MTTTTETQFGLEITVINETINEDIFEVIADEEVVAEMKRRLANK